jgi:hypothetical protein
MVHHGAATAALSTVCVLCAQSAHTVQNAAWSAERDETPIKQHKADAHVVDFS